jgi:hypothetical protein
MEDVCVRSAGCTTTDLKFVVLMKDLVQVAAEAVHLYMCTHAQASVGQVSSEHRRRAVEQPSHFSQRGVPICLYVFRHSSGCTEMRPLTSSCRLRKREALLVRKQGRP